MKNKLIVDAHLDLSMNAIEYNRDLRKPLTEIRQKERHLKDKADRGRGTVCLPELRKGRVGLVVATLLARVAPPEGSLLNAWHSPQQAWCMIQAQLTWYREMEILNEMVQIRNQRQLAAHLELWNDGNIPDEKKPIGYVLSLEGADSLVDPSYLHKLYEQGLRAIGLSHFSYGRYAPGTRSAGLLTKLGHELLGEITALDLIVDVTHLTDEGFIEVTEKYEGPIWASHHNVRSLVPTQRQLTDSQIKILIERKAVIGGMLDCWAMDIRFIDAVSDPWQLNITLDKLVDHWDHICQLSGNTEHIGIGSDLDGLFGTEQAPWDLDSIADLQKFEEILSQRHYSQTDIDNIFHNNWIRTLRQNLPA